MLVLETFLKMLVVSMATVGGLASAEAGLGPACACEPQGHLATCSFMDLTKVPACLPGDTVTQLYLDHNSIQALTTDQLQPFSQLRLLSAEGNLITELPQDMFQNTPRLREIYLSQNRIQSVSAATFLPVANLQKLVLSENHLSSIPPGTFRGLAKLLELDLSGNQLMTVPADAFPRSVRMLRLLNNHLQSLPDDWPVSLEELDISHNKLWGADAAAVQRLPALRELRLEGNPWHCTCEATGDLAALVARKNFLEDMEDPMVCAAPPELRGSQLLLVLRHCYAGSSTTSPSTPSSIVLDAASTSVQHSLKEAAGNDLSAASASSPAQPTTWSNITDVASNPANNHAHDTLMLSIAILVSICLFIVAVLMVRKFYIICREKRFCVKNDREKLTEEDEESVV